MEVEEPTKKADSVPTRGPVDGDIKHFEKPSPQEDKAEAKVTENEEKEENEAVEAGGEQASESTRVMYTKEDLVALKDTPGSLVWPSILAEDFVRSGIWDPEAWHQSAVSEKRCASPVDDIRRHLLEDGIVLSPQRQSFGQGCHVPQSAPERGSKQERTKSMLSRTLERETRDGRSRLTGRVGRGSRSLDYKERQPLRDRNRNSDLRQLSPWDRDRGDKERGDKDRKRSRDEENRSTIERRQRPAAEPEWMTYEPDNQMETMELKGFDDDMLPERRRRREKSGSFLDESFAKKERTTSMTSKDKEKVTAPKEDQEEAGNDGDQGFDINQFFMTDTILQFSGVTDQGNSSRFSQFFGGYGSNSGSRRSSTAEEMMEYSGLSSGSAATPSPTQPFVFAPIKPVDAASEPESLAEMLEKTKIDVKPLLDNVLSSEKEDNARVKGPCRLEDIEQQVAAAKQRIEAPEIAKLEAGEAKERDMAAFFKFVETMKTSGHLPDKPQPVIPGLPSKYLPRPPSPKRSRTPSPSPLQKLRRSPSPAEMVHQLMMQTQLPPPRPPSPAQVVPQLDHPHSPFEILHKSIVMSPHDLLPRQSPSPMNYMYPDKGLKPLLGPEAFTSPAPLQQFMSPRTHLDRPRFDLPMDSPLGKHTPISKMHMGKPLDTTKTRSVGKEVLSALRDPAFMPTSVLMHMKKDQMTPKAKVEDKDVTAKGNMLNGKAEKPKGTDERLVNGTAHRTMDHGIMNNTAANQADSNGERPLSPKSQLLREIAAHGPISKAPIGVGSQQKVMDNQPGSPIHPRAIPTNQGGSPLLKPTAFRPYPVPPYSPARSGSHSEPHSPMMSHNIGSPSHNRSAPHSAPVTPQRHPHAASMVQKPFQGGSPGLQMEREPPMGKVIRLEMHGHNMKGLQTEGHDARGPQIEGQAVKPEMNGPNRNNIEGVLPNGPSSPAKAVLHEQQKQKQDRLDQHRQHQQLASDALMQNRLTEGPRHSPGHHPGQHPMQHRREDLHEHRHGRQGMPDMHPPGRHDQMHHRPAHRPLHMQDLPHPHPQEMYRHRPMGPHIPGGRVSPQSLLGTPMMPPAHTPFNSPMAGLSPRQKAGMPGGMMRPPVHPAYMRMMQSPGRVPGMPIQSPMQSTMQSPMQSPMLPVQSPLMYRQAVGGYGGVNPALLSQSQHYPVQQRHPGHMYGAPPRVSSPQPLHPEPSPHKPPNGSILSKWFSDDVLRVNQLQNTAPKVQKAAPDFGKKVLSLEEVERQQAMVNT